jgi:transcriptional regulator with XRE-family HTH domain
VSTPDPIDVHVGRRIRQRRKVIGMSQVELARLVGVKFQQVQKYERGTNRVSASRMYDMAVALSVPVPYFFGDMPQDVRAGHPSNLGGPALMPEEIGILAAYWRLKPGQRKTIAAMLDSIAPVPGHA